MTLPLDTRSPHRQQRWIDCRNDDTVALAAFSVVQVLQSLRPESASSETPGGGRTVLRVSRATQNSPEVTAVLGLQNIAAGEYGMCTMDEPMWALVKSGTPAVGQEWGLGNGDSALSSGLRGFIILGGYRDGMVRVMRTCCCC